jgi:TetR/AcrR family transcriptional regulator, cholesterol catabolism regulator
MDRRKHEQPFGTAGPEQETTLSSRDRFDERLETILRASTVLFAREGYHQASMREIARAAGVSLAGVYHYCDSKERLLFLIQFRAFSALLTEVKAALLGVQDPIEQLRTLIHTHVHYVAQNMPSLKVCTHELEALTGEGFQQVRLVRREYYELARGIIGRILEERQGSPLDVRIATMSLFGMLNWLYRWYDPNRERSPSSLATQIFNQFLPGLLCSELAAAWRGGRTAGAGGRGCLIAGNAGRLDRPPHRAPRPGKKAAS